jgi:hypothetical protein
MSFGAIQDFWDYLKSNFWSFLPAAAAITVIMTAHWLIEIESRSCQLQPNGLGNWVLCDGPALKGVLDQALPRSAELAKPPNSDFTSQDPTVSRYWSEKLASLFASKDIPTIAPTSGSDTLKARNDAIEARLKTASDLVAHLQLSPIAISLREAKARIAWLSSLGVLLLAASATFGGSWWLSFDALSGHARAMGLGSTTIVRMCLQGLLMIVLMLILAFVVELVLYYTFELPDYNPLFGFDFFLHARSTIPSDALMAWWASVVPTDMLERYHAVVAFAALATISVMGTVTSTLHQGPNDRAFRTSTDVSETAPANGSNDPHMAKAVSRDILYCRYLGRCFLRLRYAIYLGSAMLAATVAEVSTRYAWPVAVVQDVQPATLVSAIDGIGQQYTLQVGVYFSIFLASLYYPAITILRNRGREYIRSRKPESDLKAQETWLEDQGLAFRFSTNWTELLALATPTAIGTLGHFTKVFGG